MVDFDQVSPKVEVVQVYNMDSIQGGDLFGVVEK